MTNPDYSALESILQRRSTKLISSYMNVKNRIMLHFKLKPVEVTCNTGHKETHPNAA